MKTIIYLYPGREQEKYVWERWPERDYCLIRLGIPTLLWQKQQPALRKTPVLNETAVRNETAACLEELTELQTVFILLGDGPYRIYCVYEAYLKEKLDRSLWRQYWEIPEFTDYRQYMWVEKLMQYTFPGPYILLGYADCLPRILREHSKSLRSVKWFLKEAQYSSGVEEFVEEFLEEYGLAIEIHLLAEKELWLGVRPGSTFPVNVLDFSGEEKLSACDAARGSVWLDMDSLDGKNRRIESRNPGVSYFSMKKLWKQRQKEAICLDTIGKNGYNT